MTALAIANREGPRTAGVIEALVVRMAADNRDWGYRRIQGALSNLGHEIGRSTIATILKRHGIEPAPERGGKTTWKEFLTRHWELIVAADFFTIEVWTRYGLQRFIVLFFIELSTRKVEIGGISRTANGLWMNQIARNLTYADEGITGTVPPSKGLRYAAARGAANCRRLNCSECCEWQNGNAHRRRSERAQDGLLRIDQAAMLSGLRPSRNHK